MDIDTQLSKLTYMYACQSAIVDIKFHRWYIVLYIYVDIINMCSIEH